jgi:Skp family chaperone for outer membrane proteins
MLCLGVLPSLLLGQISGTSGKVGAVNLQKAILNTTEGKEAIAELEKKYQPRQQELQKLHWDITAATRRLQQQSPTLSAEQRRRLKRELEDKQAVLKRGTEDAQAAFAAERDEILGRIGQEMVKQIADYAKENGFSLIIASDRVRVYYAAKEAALTGEIIKRCQNQLAAKQLAPLLNWNPGNVVAEIGAGDGGLTLAAAERVGPTGRVYTTELDPEKLAQLESLAAKQKDRNITVVKAGEAETNLPRECCDSIFMRGVYHHFTQPAKEDASLFRSLKPGGLLAIIDFPPGNKSSDIESVKGVPKNRGGHGMPKQLLLDELSAAGFQAVTTPTHWHGEDYCVVVRKPAK